MVEVTRRSAVAGSITLLAASEMGEEAAGKTVTPTEATATFPAPITAMTEVQLGKLAVACGADLYIIKIR